MRNHCFRLLIVCLLISSFSVCFGDDAGLWSEASAKKDSGDLLGAATLLNQLLTDFPTSPKAPASQLELGRIKLQLTPEDTQGLLDAFSLLKSKYPASYEVADACVHIGYLHSRTDAKQAIKDFEESIADERYADFVGSIFGSLRQGASLDQAITRDAWYSGRFDDLYPGGFTASDGDCHNWRVPMPPYHNLRVHGNPWSTYLP